MTGMTREEADAHWARHFHDKAKRLEDENERLRGALARTGGVAMLAQCPSCLAERTNGERHADDCPIIAQADPLRLPAHEQFQVVIESLNQSLASWRMLARRRAKLLETIRVDLSSEAVLQAPRQRAHQLVEIITRELGD